MKIRNDCHWIVLALSVLALPALPIALLLLPVCALLSLPYALMLWKAQSEVRSERSAMQRRRALTEQRWAAMRRGLAR